MSHEFTPSYVTARIGLIETALGGRATPIVSGYRGLFRFENEVMGYSIYMESLEPNPIASGADGTTVFRFIVSWEKIKDRIVPGLHFSLYEGPKVVGYGEVTAISD